jgi:hypothetical protein
MELCQSSSCTGSAEHRTSRGASATTKIVYMPGSTRIARLISVIVVTLVKTLKVVNGRGQDWLSVGQTLSSRS